MRCSDDTFVRFALCNDIFEPPIFSKKELRNFAKSLYHGNLSAARSLTLWAIADIVKDNQLAEKIYTCFRKNYDDFFEKLDKRGIFILGEKDENYPNRISQKIREEAPVFFYVQGSSKLLNLRSASVTGSRNMSEAGLRFSADIGEAIAKENRVLVSGGARGCDFSATKSALLTGGSAVWFMAIPYDEVETNQNICRYIEDNRLCLCWDFNPFSRFEGKNALRRNRYIYANSETAFVCQCNSKISGTFSGANYALKNNLCELFVYDNNSQASKELIKNGAIAIIDDNC